MARPTAHKMVYGRVFGTVYDYKEGDVLDLHQHTVETNHITIVTNGKLEVFGDTERAGDVLTAGMVAEWEPNVSHGIKALAPSRMINLLVHDKEVEGDV